MRIFINSTHTPFDWIDLSSFFFWTNFNEIISFFFFKRSNCLFSIICFVRWLNLEPQGEKSPKPSHPWRFHPKCSEPCQNGRWDPIQRHSRNICPMIQQTLGSNPKCPVLIQMHQLQIQRKVLHIVYKLFLFLFPKLMFLPLFCFIFFLVDEKKIFTVDSRFVFWNSFLE